MAMTTMARIKGISVASGRICAYSHGMRSLGILMNAYHPLPGRGKSRLSGAQWRPTVDERIVAFSYADYY